MQSDEELLLNKTDHAQALINKKAIGPEKRKENPEDSTDGQAQNAQTFRQKHGQILKSSTEGGNVQKPHHIFSDTAGR